MTMRIKPHTVPAHGFAAGQRFDGYLPAGIYEEYRPTGKGQYAIVSPVGGTADQHGWAAYFVDPDYLPGDDPQVSLAEEIREARAKLEQMASHLGAVVEATRGVDDVHQRMGVVQAQAELMRRGLVEARQSLNACWSVVNQEGHR